MLVLIMGLASCDYAGRKDAGNVPVRWESLSRNAATAGKPEWQPMLKYVAELHENSSHPAEYPFPCEWKEIGPGYIYGPAFGHWDIVHQCLDVMEFFPGHALHQLLNNIENQEPSGLIPGSI